MKKKEDFTLIEIIAVLVILAILALIVTPLVLNIIKKARTAADKRSIDAYGRSVELAIADYLLDKGEFPTSIEELLVEYSGDKVECTTAQLNSDSTVYLAGCTVGGRNVYRYTYGKEETVTYDAYKVGDEVTYNNVNYYVIKDSDETETSVTLLKAEPLTYEEVQTYSAGTGSLVDRHANYGGMQYHLTSNLYESSFIKQTVDAWAKNNIIGSSVSEIRLITIEELTDNLGYEIVQECGSSACYDIGQKTENTPSWAYNSGYTYWTMSAYDDSPSKVWRVESEYLRFSGVNNGYGSDVVRPVIVLSKSAL